MQQHVQDPLVALRERFARAIVAAYPTLEGPADPAVVPSKQPQLADFQCNAAMALSKRVGQPPRVVAQAIVAKLDLSGVAEPVTEAAIAGPGFINVRLSSAALAAALVGMQGPELGVTIAATPQTIVVDLMGVNLAKQMHVGHLRSPVIGDALARTLERFGHRVIRQNHVGDWGLPIAMVTARLMRMADAGQIDLQTLTLDDLDSAYRTAQIECQRDATGLEAARRMGHPKAIAELEAQVAGATEAFLAARQTLVKLQAKDPQTYGVWQRIYQVTMAVCVEVCELLDVRVREADSAGESSYADELAGIVDDLLARGVAEHDQGAVIVRLDAPPPTTMNSSPAWEAVKEPCLIRKTDGGFLYATTDLAAIRRRVQKFQAHRGVYAIDARQSLQMRQVYAASRKAGYATHPITKQAALLEHAAFGSVLGEDGKPFKTRSGESVKLADLLRETFDRAEAAVRTRNPELTSEESRAIARGVGIAALKYADLSTDRIKDYIFSFDRMLAFEGDTGPYLLNALVRIKSIFRKALEKGVGDGWRDAPFMITQPHEKALALTLLRYPATLVGTAESLQPHRLCQYLFELAGAYASFYEACPVLAADDIATRDGRLKLCDLTGRVLSDGLACLGIPAIERM
jgi:arginyl-tRNA synthetase